jgi:hypothetical protein
MRLMAQRWSWHALTIQRGERRHVRVPTRIKNRGDIRLSARGHDGGIVNLPNLPVQLVVHHDMAAEPESLFLGAHDIADFAEGIVRLASHSGQPFRFALAGPCRFVESVEQLFDGQAIAAGSWTLRLSLRIHGDIFLLVSSLSISHRLN